MNAHLYKKRLYCEPCGDLICSTHPHAGLDDPGDSDEYPQLKEDGGGVADRPQHCWGCFKFLENPISSQGVEYVLEFMATNVNSPEVSVVGVDPIAVWAKFYGLENGVEPAEIVGEDLSPDRFFGG